MNRIIQHKTKVYEINLKDDIASSNLSCSTNKYVDMVTDRSRKRGRDESPSK